MTCGRMSANVELTIYENHFAIILPREAIGGNIDNAFVMVRAAGNGRSRRVPVQIGYVSSNAVKIRAGLEPSDIVIWGLTPVQEWGGAGFRARLKNERITI